MLRKVRKGNSKIPHNSNWKEDFYEQCILNKWSKTLVKISILLYYNKYYINIKESITM